MKRGFLMSEYKNNLIKKLERYYDIEEEVTIESHTFDLMATYSQKNAKYLLVKDFEYCSFNNNEYIFYKKIEDAQLNINNFKAFLKNNLQEIVSIEKNHMSSLVTFLIETSFPLDHETISTIEKFKFHKSFRFGLDGWVNAQLIVIDPKQEKGYTNAFARKELDKYLS
jgi:hypothetical protein